MRFDFRRRSALAAGPALALLLSLLFAAGTGSAQELRVEEDVQYGEAEGEALLLDAYLPEGEGPHPAVVVIHSGGWARGDKSEWASEGAMLSENGYAAFVINYRLAPEFHFPAQIDDCRAAVAWVREHAAEYDVDPARVGAFGGSAGGNLAALLATSGEGPLDTGSRVLAAVSWSGPMDLTQGRVSVQGGGGALRRYLGAPAFRDPQVLREASPLYQVDPTDAPIYLAHSTREFIPSSQATDMADALREAGVPHDLLLVEGGAHSQGIADEAWAPSLAFLDEHLEGATSTTGTSPEGGGTPVTLWLLVAGAAALVLVGLVVTLRRRGPSGPS